MLFSVRHLLEGRGEPFCVGPQDSVREALDLMFEYDYSQLPVVDQDRKPLGMIHHESIVQAHSSFGLPVDQLIAADAMEGLAKPDLYGPDDDLFDMLNRLRDSNAVLIVDNDGRLIGIVTNYDAMEYFRRHFEDTMLVEDIEAALKAHILAAFTDQATGRVDDGALSSAIQVVTSIGRVPRGRLERALSAYLAHQGFSADLNPEAVGGALSVFDEKAPPKPFEDLTLHDYIQLLLYQGRSEYYARFLTIDPDALRRLLHDVRDIRNELFHFRGEISTAQREQLRVCSDWFERHPVPMVEVSTAEGIIPSEEELAPGESRYAPLGHWLQSLSMDKVLVTFAQIEQVIDDKLPESARQHRAWWANDSTTHAQSQQWLDAGWRVSTVNVPRELVVFMRAGGRQRAYMDFYNELLRQFAPVAPFQFKKGKFPTGTNWHVVRGLPDGGSQRAVLGFTFAHHKRFRVELYIDGGSQERNKRAFDLLYAQKESIEAAVGAPLSWERIDSHRASRIALYRPGAITDSAEDLIGLRAWAVDAMIRFFKAIREPANQALRTAWNVE